MYTSGGFMVKTKKKSPPGVLPNIPYSYNANLFKRNKALFYTLGGFSILLYIISFVRMGQW
jgi:hypothetical protein